MWFSSVWEERCGDSSSPVAQSRYRMRRRCYWVNTAALKCNYGLFICAFGSYLVWDERCMAPINVCTRCVLCLNFGRIILFWKPHSFHTSTSENFDLCKLDYICSYLLCKPCVVISERISAEQREQCGAETDGRQIGVINANEWLDTPHTYSQ